MFEIEEMLAYPTKITEYLFLSSVDCLEDIDFFKENKITHVLSVLKDAPTITDKFPDVKQLIISINDSPIENIRSHFDAVFAFINDVKNQQTKMLVHCEKGISRSASMVIAWLLHEQHGQQLPVNYFDTLKALQKKRTAISPNAGFAQQLKDFANDLNTKLLSSAFPELGSNDYLFFTEQHWSAQDVYQTCTALKACGFPRINLALLIGFAGQTAMVPALLSPAPHEQQTIIKNLLIGATHGSQLTFIKTLRASIKDVSPDVLSHAVGRNNTDLLRYLDNEYPHLTWDFLNNSGNNLLFIAAFHGCLEVFIFLLEIKKLNPHQLNNSNSNLLTQLAYTNNENLIAYVRNNQKEISPHHKNNSGLSAYNIACKRDNQIFLALYKDWKPQTVPAATVKTKDMRI
jgi:predicted protein tyrosine phosphatase